MEEGERGHLNCTVVGVEGEKGSSVPAVRYCRVFVFSVLQMVERFFLFMSEKMGIFAQFFKRKEKIIFYDYVYRYHKIHWRRPYLR